MTEIDPNGIEQHELGAKLDAGKPLSAEILGQFALALTEVAKIGTFGANKYTIGGWKHVKDGVIRYDNAAMRHFLKRHSGEEIDPDSGLLHMSHEAWNALARLELYLQNDKVGVNVNSLE